MGLKSYIREIPDFPKPGINFKDITPLLQNSEAFHQAVDVLAEKVEGFDFDKIMAVESRGFIFASALAYKLNKGFVPVRKKGKLPYKTISYTYQLEYGQDTLEVHEDALQKGDRVLIVDDLLATGGTAEACIQLTHKLSAEVSAIVFLIELTFLKGREKLKDYPVVTIVKFDS
ncbi:MAG: adenine phosphoribosyltransferase [Candidatus Omnitrophica bacterium 4484_49]|nr:adenine phosphoribosyltransferase [Candidatus Omnitrophota bacterium]OQX83450.1 MAG: adenine phosphoribosyltransferase [Candidatus Omnitrophica bacterium 4484_49]